MTRLSDEQLERMRRAVLAPDSIGTVKPRTIVDLIDEVMLLRYREHKYLDEWAKESIELVQARAELDRMRQVWEACKVWRQGVVQTSDGCVFVDTFKSFPLMNAIDAALAEGKR